MCEKFGKFFKKMELIESSFNPLSYLPYELLEIIFSFLKTSDLKNLLTLGDRTRDVIVTSPITMRKLKLRLMEDWLEKVAFVKQYGHCVKDLEFDFCNFDTPNQFRDLMKFMRNVENLRLSNVHIAAENFNKKYNILAMKFHKLDVLDVDNSQAMGKLVKLYLKKVEMRCLRIDFCHYNVNHELVKLMWNQPYLETLELAGFNNILYQSLFQQYDISYTIYLNLKKLILNFRVTPNQFFLNFFKVLTMESLEILKEIEFQELFNVIFTMENLRSLTLATNFVTLKNIDFKKVTQSKIDELTLITRSQYGIEQTINYLVSKLPNLKTLKVDNLKTDSSDQLLGFVYLKKLEKLEIKNSKLKFIQNIKFDNLKTLHLTSIHPFLKFEDWENFFRTNKHIEELFISEFEVYYVTEAIKTELNKIFYNLHFIEKSLKYFEVNQELRYQKPIKLVIKNTEKCKIMKVSDSFIKICREEFHMLRKIADFNLFYYSDDCFEINNKYLK